MMAMEIKWFSVLDDENKFELTSKNISDFRDLFELSEHMFCFGSMLFNFPTSYDEDR